MTYFSNQARVQKKYLYLCKRKTSSISSISSTYMTANDLDNKIPTTPTLTPNAYNSPIENKNEYFNLTNWFFLCRQKCQLHSWFLTIFSPVNANSIHDSLLFSVQWMPTPFMISNYFQSCECQHVLYIVNKVYLVLEFILAFSLYCY